jgi:hypothetical protein
VFPTSPFLTACYALFRIVYDDLPHSTVDLGVLAIKSDRTFDPFAPCFGLAVLCSYFCNAIAVLRNGKATYVKVGIIRSCRRVQRYVFLSVLVQS